MTRKWLFFGALVFVFCVCGLVQASVLVSYSSGANSADVPDYGWWYGCSATSAGMAIGYYDINGYEGLRYDNLVPGGLAEYSTFGGGSYIANSAIASSGHIADFYGGGYMATGDDVASPWHNFDCLADFMGTSQDAYGNPNGGTTFWFWNNGAPMHWSDLQTLGPAHYNSDGMYGIREYIQYAGYDIVDAYSQCVDTVGLTYGFTWDQYVAEIDAGRVVLIQVQGHTMLGYDYTLEGELIHLYDTWSESDDHVMTWGGSYAGMQQYGVTVFELMGGEGAAVPAPAALWLAVIGLSSWALVSRTRSRGN
ncbi:MAG: hypothetical protein V2A58_12800 [Planctomycetota bacterium]